MIKKIIIYTLLSLFVASFIGILLLGKELPSSTEDVKEMMGIGSDQPIDEKKTDTTGGSNVSLEGSGGGGGGGGGGGSEEATVGPNSCPLKQISYSLRNFNTEVVCLNYGENGCDSLQATCKVTAYNLDPLISGDFKIVLKITDLESFETLQESTITHLIGPLENSLFELKFNLENPAGVNENLKCDFNPIDLPQKEDCS